MTPERIRKLVDEHGRWWHRMELAPGVVTPGFDDTPAKLATIDRIGFPADLRGRRVLEIGASDGFFSFEAERRGARVVAIDLVPETHTGFGVAKQILGSAAEWRADSVYNLSPETYGYFDVVIFLGVLYHLRKPQAALDAIRSVVRPGALLIIGTLMIDEQVLLPDGTFTKLAAIHPILSSIPLWQTFPGASMNHDATNHSAPNLAALKVALAESQFRFDEFDAMQWHGFARATAIADEEAAKYARLDARLERNALDASVPYFLDEEGSARVRRI